jgi:hypothetical protein
MLFYWQELPFKQWKQREEGKGQVIVAIKEIKEKSKDGIR